LTNDEALCGSRNFFCGVSSLELAPLQALTFPQATQ
jgi:hypothetical protein